VTSAQPRAKQFVTSLLLVETQPQRIFRCNGCSLKIHRVEISVADGKFALQTPCHQQHFDCVKAKFNFEKI
jgi:hypothetical protein